jgi:hypothetical protein
MSRVNIDCNWSFCDNRNIGSRYVDVCLKELPEHFVVQEIYDPVIPIVESVEKIGTYEHTSHKRICTAPKSCLSKKDAIDIISATVWRKLFQLNNESQSMKLGIDKIQAQLLIAQHKRNQLRLMILDSFPFISLENNQLNTSKDSLQDSIILTAKPDNTLLRSLLSSGMTMVDVEAIYRFKNLGSRHPQATLGIRIGEYLTRESRGNCFRILRSHCPALESKTVDSRSTDKKVMLIHWSQKVLRSAHKNQAKSSNRGAGNTVTSLTKEPTHPQEIYLHFTLMKRDIEHLQAVQRLAQLVGAAVSDVGTAGTKDKRAVTYQQCCVLLRVHHGIDTHTTSSAAVRTRDNNLSDNSSVTTNMTHHRNVPDGSYLTRGSDPLLSSDRVVADLSSFDPACIPVSEHLFCSQSLLSGALGDRVVRAVEALRPLLPPHNHQYQEYLSQTSHTAQCKPFLAVSHLELKPKHCGGLVLGQLWGNRFNITLPLALPFALPQSSDTTVSPDPTAFSISEYVAQAMSNVNESLRTVQQDGFPNYYGSQRMGYLHSSVRAPESTCVCMPVGPRIGRLLLQGRLLWLEEAQALLHSPHPQPWALASLRLPALLLPWLPRSQAWGQWVLVAEVPPLAAGAQVVAGVLLVVEVVEAVQQREGA